MSFLSKFTRTVVGDIGRFGMVNGVEGGSPVESRQERSLGLVHNPVHS